MQPTTKPKRTLPPARPLGNLDRRRIALAKIAGKRNRAMANRKGPY